MLATHVTSGWSYFTLYNFRYVGCVILSNKFLYAYSQYVGCELIEVTGFLKLTADQVLVFDLTY